MKKLMNDFEETGLEILAIIETEKKLSMIYRGVKLRDVYN